MNCIFKTISIFVLNVITSGLVYSETLRTGEPIKIGVIYGFTGAAQVWSDYGRMGLELARDEINQSGGIHGRKLKLIFEDSKTNPAQSVAAYRKLTTIDGVKVIIGNVWDFITEPLIPLAQRDQVILLSPTVMPESAQTRSNYFFSMGASVASIHDAADLFFKKNPGIRRIGIFCWDDHWGQAYLKVWREVAAQNSVKIEAELCSIDFGTDFRTDVTKMATKKIDGVIIAHMADVVLQRMKEQNFSTKVLTNGNVVEEIRVKKAPKELFEGIYLTDWQPSNDFIQRFKAKFNKEPVVEAHNSYEALQTIAKALALNGNDLLASLKKVKYVGVAGPIDFTSSSFGNHTAAKLFQVKNGEFEPVS